MTHVRVSLDDGGEHFVRTVMLAAAGQDQEISIGGKPVAVLVAPDKLAFLRAEVARLTRLADQAGAL